jgi:uncharacterized protein (DUF362 family)
MTASEAPSAVVVDDTALGSGGLLEAAIERGGLWHELELACAAGATPSSLRIVVKPELGAFSLDSPVATDPRLVERLVALLHGRGYDTVSVVASADSSATWAENRGVLALAELLGYRWCTEAGRSYEIVDLANDLAIAPFPAGAVLHGSALSRTWSEAQFRISFVKNRTDETQGFSLCLDGLLGVLPLTDKDYHYRHRRDAGDVIVELLRATPVHFALIDAVQSCHGAGGARAPLGIDTHTVIASRNPLLADMAGALKMGLDPHVSPVVRKVSTAIGLPRRYGFDGNLATYPGWKNVPPSVGDSSRRRDSWTAASRLLRPWIQATDPEVFPFKSPIDARVNESLVPFLDPPQGDHGALAPVVLLNYAVAQLHDLLASYRVLFDKDALRHREVPLGFDPAAYTLAEYEDATTDVLALTDLLRATPVDENGLRWRYVEQAVVFEIARSVAIPFEEFVAKVDVSRTIQYMNDYVGGVAVPVARDTLGRVTHQAERNLYLPQPNYLVLAQGKVIDVSKLEHVEYADDLHRMGWKTIGSENGSARYDDGVVAFQPVEGGTRISIAGRQLFTLPPFWEALNLDLYPEVKSHLVTHAYTTFFSRTFANLEAVAEGRDVRLGRAWQQTELPSDTEPRPVDRIVDVLTDLGEKYGPLLESDLERLLAAGPERARGALDGEGFEHFSGAGGPVPDPKRGLQSVLVDTARDYVSAFWRDVMCAMRLDAERALRESVEARS